MADSAARHGLTFPALTDGQNTALSAHLSGLVTLANPLDYHTGIWRDKTAMTAVFSAMAREDVELVIVVLDFPRPDMCDLSDWMIAVEAIEAAADQTGRPYGVLASVPENMPEGIAEAFLAKGIVPLCDFDHGLGAVAKASFSPAAEASVLPAAPFGDTITLTEGQAKADLAAFGVDVPQGVSGVAIGDLQREAEKLGYPLVLKGEGVAHKSEAGLVALGLQGGSDVLAAARKMDCDRFALDQMVAGAVAELLVGVVRDPAHGFVLTLGAGGTMTEVLEDKASLLIPASEAAVDQALGTLRSDAFLRGYRGAPAADRNAVLAAVMAVQNYVIENAAEVVEVEINPLICTAKRAVAVDALIVKEIS